MGLLGGHGVRARRPRMESKENDRIAYAQDLTCFHRSAARVGGQAVVVVEAGFGAPCRDMRAAVVGEDLLEAGNDDSRVRVARGNRTPRARIAAFEIHFADAKAHGAAFFLAEELIFPERRDFRSGGRRAVAIDFECGAKAQAHFLECHTGKKPANSLQASGSALALSHHTRSEEHTSELQSPDHLVCRLLLEKKKYHNNSLPLESL